jgi:DNA polymerase III subunit epsilon
MAHRIISLDTETTGLDFHKGERLVEIALVEIIDRSTTGRVFHSHINPQRKVDPDAFRVHGLSDEFLANKPLFRDVADEMLAFIGKDDLLIHNAEFDLTFLNGELARAGKPPIQSLVLDTLEWVKTVEPGKRASLDAMADRHGVDRSSRLLHGALIDARLLADVYVFMTRHQSGLDWGMGSAQSGLASKVDLVGLGSKLMVTGVNQQEQADHEAYLDSLDKETKGKCVWIEAAKSSGARLRP